MSSSESAASAPGLLLPAPSALPPARDRLPLLLPAAAAAACLLEPASAAAAALLLGPAPLLWLCSTATWPAYRLHVTHECEAHVNRSRGNAAHSCAHMPQYTIVSTHGLQLPVQRHSTHLQKCGRGAQPTVKVQVLHASSAPPPKMHLHLTCPCRQSRAPAAPPACQRTCA